MKSILSFLLSSIVLIALCGCGGGGGLQARTLSYQTDWTNRLGAGGGLSQRVSFFDSQDRLITSFTADQSLPSLETYPIDGLPTSVLHVRLELFSQHALGGILVGTINTVLDLSAVSQYASTVGVAPANIVVSPSAATITIPESAQFYAATTSASGVPTFSDPADITWQTLGGVATVNSDGLVASTQSGSGTLRATFVPGSLQGSATIQVQGFTPTTSKWTVLVFMNAANDLYSFSTLNMNQMERVAQSSDVRFVVQWKQAQSIFPNSIFNGTRRYLVQPDMTSAIASRLIQNMGSGIDMGRPQTLADFIQWGKTYYPSQHTCLIIWNHGNGWRRTAHDLAGPKAVSYDDETGHAIQIWELGAAFGANHFDLLAWDASLMQMQEVAYEVRNSADFVVGSEESPPGEGYPYDAIFSTFRDNPDGTPRMLSKAFVDGMLGVPGYASRKITQSVLDTSKLSTLASKTSILGTQLLANGSTMTSTIQDIRNQAQSYSQNSTRYYRDLRDVCSRLAGSPVATAASDVIAAIDQAIVWEGHNANSPASRGIAIDFSPGSVFLGSALDYSQLKFGADTQWDEWLSFAP